MEFSLFIICLAIAFTLFRKHNRLERELLKLQLDFQDLRRSLAEGTLSPSHAEPVENIEPKPNEATPFQPEESRPLAQPFIKPASAEPEPAVLPSKPAEPSPMASLLAQARNNWAGVLGAFILVMGVGFFAFLASARMGPVGRFSSIVLGGILSAGFAQFLRRKDNWSDFSAWLFGIAGSVLLIACMGASGLKPLRFIEEPGPALLLLMLGVSVNLGLAFHVRNQYSNAFHGLISLCALACAPAHDTILLAATASALAALGLAYRRCWDRNNVAMILGYVAFHLYLLTQGVLSRPIGMASALSFALVGAAIHYDKVYREQAHFMWPLLAHLTNWLGLAILLAQYTIGSPWTAGLIIAAGFGLLIMARVARRHQISWLFHADSLIGQLLVLVGIFQLRRLQVDCDLLLTFAVAFSGFFCFLCLSERERLLARVALAAQTLLYLGLVLWSITASGDRVTTAFLLAGIAAQSAFQYYLLQKRELADGLLWEHIRWDQPFLVMALSAFLMAQLGWSSYAWGSPTAAVGWLLLIHALHRYVARDIMMWHVALVLAHLILFKLPDFDVPPAVEALLRIGPFVILDGLLIRQGTLRTKAASLIQTACYLGAAGIAAYLHASTFSSSHFAPSVLDLVASVVALELGIHLSGRKLDVPLHRWILHAGAGFLVLFFLHHLLVNIQSEAYLGPFPLRRTLGVAGLVTLAYWLAFVPALQLNKAFPEWTTFLWEGMIVLLLLLISLELGATARPLALAALSLGLLIMILFRSWPYRLAFYSWALLIASGIQLCYVLAQWPDLTQQWWTSATAYGWSTLVLQILQVAFTYRSRVWKQAADHWNTTGRLQRLMATIIRRHNWLNFYPVMLFAALYVYWHFDRAVLTLLWFVEVFVVFVLGLAIRDRHFVKISYLFLALCAGRLLLHDLAQSDLAVRAGVFIFCGLLMLGINALQRKFQHRLDEVTS